VKIIDNDNPGVIGFANETEKVEEVALGECASLENKVCRDEDLESKQGTPRQEAPEMTEEQKAAKQARLEERKAKCLEEAFAAGKLSCFTTAHIEVQRRNGAVGDITMSYHTESNTAVSPDDYEHVEGELEFKDGEHVKWIDVKVMKSGRYER